MQPRLSPSRCLAPVAPAVLAVVFAIGPANSARAWDEPRSFIGPPAPRVPSPSPASAPDPLDKTDLGSQNVPLMENAETRPLIPAGSAVSPGAAPTVGVPEASDLGPTAISVASVVGLIVILAGGVHLARRGRGGTGLNSSRSPAGILEVLGRYPLSSGPTLVLLRVGERILLLSQARASRLSGSSLSTLAEFDDPDHVAAIIMQARDARDESISARFAALLAGFSAEDARSTNASAEAGTLQASTGAFESESLATDDAPLQDPYALPTDERGGASSSMLRRRLEGLRAWEGATA